MKKSFFKFSKIAAISLILSSGVAFADINDSYRAMSLQEVTNLSNQGNSQALVELGFRYDRGNGVEKNQQKAYELYLKAAEGNSVRAQNNIGALYASKKDYAQALVWYEKAAKNPSKDEDTMKALAYKNLAEAYLYSKGVEKDLDKALDLYLESEKLYPTSAVELDTGYIYEQKKDYDEAKKWYEKASRNSDYVGDSNVNRPRAIAYGNLGNFYKFGREGIEKDLDKALELYLLGESLYPRVKTQDNLADLYEKKKDFLNAAKWYEKSFLEEPKTEKFVNISKAYSNAGLTAGDKSLQYFLNEYKKSNSLFAAFFVAGTYGQVLGDYPKSLEWLNRIVQFKTDQKGALFLQGSAYLLMAKMYQEGKGVPKNLNKALEFALAAEKLDILPELVGKDRNKLIAEIYEQKGNAKKAAEYRAKK